MRPSLAPLRSVLDAAGSPDGHYRAVQVVGSVGKGSCAATLASLAKASELRVGFFSSPHLVRFTERFRVQGQETRPEVLWEAFCELREQAPWSTEDPRALGVPEDRRGLTFFEWAVALGAVLFKREGCDWVVWEAGLGGRWDGTSALQADFNVVTRIALDHQKVLGETLEAIAAEKAAAFRPSRPVILGAQEAGAREVLVQRARALDCPVEDARPEAALGTGTGAGGAVPGLRLSLLGAHQRENAALALVGHRLLCRLAKRPAPTHAVQQRGLSATRWPGRLEWLDPSTLVDGAHNLVGCEALAVALPALAAGRQVHAIFGCLNARDPVAMIAALAPTLHSITLTAPRSDRAMETELYFDQVSLRFASLQPRCAPSLSLALRQRQAPTQLLERGALTLIFGSLYLVGEALALLDQRGMDPGDPSPEDARV